MVPSVIKPITFVQVRCDSARFKHIMDFYFKPKLEKSLACMTILLRSIRWSIHPCTDIHCEISVAIDTNLES